MEYLLIPSAIHDYGIILNSWIPCILALTPQLNLLVIECDDAPMEVESIAIGVRTLQHDICSCELVFKEAVDAIGIRWGACTQLSSPCTRHRSINKYEVLFQVSCSMEHMRSVCSGSFAASQQAIKLVYVLSNRYIRSVYGKVSARAHRRSPSISRRRLFMDATLSSALILHLLTHLNTRW